MTIRKTKPIIKSKKSTSRSRVTGASGEVLRLKQSRSRGRKKPAMMSEHYQQSAFISWCRAAAEMQAHIVSREALNWAHAIPNGFLNTGFKRLKAHQEGMKSGVHDVFIACPQQGIGGGKLAFFSARLSTVYHGFYIEFKKPGERMSDTQVQFANYLSLVGYKTIVAYSWQEAARAVVEYLSLPNGSYPEIGESEYETYVRIKHNRRKSMRSSSSRKRRNTLTPQRRDRSAGS